MGRPRMIIIIRHAQSEGNRNREIHQRIPDHRVKLTPEGHAQAEQAGHRLRSMLRPDDTLQFYTSPYRRTRETTEGILRSLTADTPSPSPFPRHAIKVWEEPRLREQDFGNFQPCSSAMERMWQERADYGHFFYRIPDGESAADAYDRVSGFNETLFRSFGDEDFPSVCVLVTHGLMTRVFLMKWYHWSVEYFEDLRNVNHCEFVVMKSEKSDGEGSGSRGQRGKFVLQNELRTWSELKKRNAEEREARARASQPSSPEAPRKKQWGGCPDGCSHDHQTLPVRLGRRSTHDKMELQTPKSLSSKSQQQQQQPPSTNIEPPTPAGAAPSSLQTTTSPSPPKSQRPAYEEDEEAFPHNNNSDNKNNATPPRSLPDWSDPHQKAQIPTTEQPLQQRPTTIPLPRPSLHPRPDWMQSGRDAGGSRSGAATPADETDSEYEKIEARPKRGMVVVVPGGERKGEKDYDEESGMGVGARADALGDRSLEGSEASEVEEEEIEEEGEEGEEKEEEVEKGGGKSEHKPGGELDGGPGQMVDLEFLEAKKRDRSLRGSVY